MKVVVGVGGIYAVIQNSRVEKISGLNRPVGNREAAIPKVVAKGDPVNILLVGNDSRAFARDAKDRKEFGARTVESQRSDTIMVIRLDPRNDRASILSIARDLYVDLDRGGRGRVNEAFARKDNPSKPDPDRLIRTIRSSFGISVNHYVEIDFAGFRQVVDAIGGVDVYFPFPARDEFTAARLIEAGIDNVKVDGGFGVGT